jgi:putative membrane protein
MSFLGFSVRAPLAVLIAIVYLLGAATGGSLVALLLVDMINGGIRQ